MKSHKALFAGTFEIFHEGHLDVLLQASEIFFQVFVAVSVNENKQSSSLDERYFNVLQTIKNLKLKNVIVIKNSGMTYQCAINNQCNYLIRGVRNEKDFHLELQLAQANESYCPNLRTILLVAKKTLINISSTITKQK